MDEVIYDLLLTSRYGLTLLGTLRYGYANPQDEVARGGDFAAMLAEALQRPSFEFAAFALKGTLSVPLLNGFRSVPITGVALVSPAAPLTTLFTSAGPSRPIDLQFNSFDLREIFGGLMWRKGQPGQVLFSVLGTPRPFGLQHDE